MHLVKTLGASLLERKSRTHQRYPSLVCSVMKQPGKAADTVHEFIGSVTLR